MAYIDEDRVVVLEERASFVAEFPLANVFGDYLVVVCLAELLLQHFDGLVGGGVEDFDNLGGYAVNFHGSLVFSCNRFADGILAEEESSAFLVLCSEILPDKLPCLFHSLADCGSSYGTVFDIKYEGRGFIVETNIWYRCILLPSSPSRSLEVRRQFRPILVLQWTRHDILDLWQQARREVEEVLVCPLYNSALVLELVGIRKLLELTAAALSEVLALHKRIIALWGRRDVSKQIRKRNLLNAAAKLNLHLFSRQCKWHNIDSILCLTHSQ